MKQDIHRVFVAAAVWLLVIGFSISRVAFPPDLTSDTAESGAIVDVMLGHIERISRETHPVGSTAHDLVGNYIAQQIAELGHSVETQTVAVAELTGEPRWAEGESVTNILTRVSGTGGGRAVLVTGHYDSVPASLGAADDGSAVASMLALLGSIEEGMFRNDVIFLFSDGEEPCLCGARAFATGHPWAPDIGMVLNFEARGTSGPSVMFETSEGNGGIVSQYAAAAKHPVSSSLYYEIYKLLPNNTDLTVYKVAEIPGINFAFIDGFRNYHTEKDSLANLDHNSLFHHYTNMETMLRQFADADLDTLVEDDVVFFDVLSLFVVSYSYVFALLGIVLCAVLFGALLVAELKPGRNKGMKMFAMLMMLLAFYGATAWLLAYMNTLNVPAGQIGDFSDSSGKLHLLLFSLVNGAVFILALHYAGRFFARFDIVVPVLALWLLILIGVFYRMPGASYILMWPLLFMLIGIHLEKYCAGKNLPAGLGIAASIVFPLPLLIIWSQLVYAILLAMTLQASLVISALTLFALSLLGFYLLPEKRKGKHVI
ncbi:MAG: M28 family peptidase [Pseudomonadota bacterium]